MIFEQFWYIDLVQNLMQRNVPDVPIYLPEKENSDFTDYSNRQKTLNYVISDRSLKHKLAQCKNSKDILEFLDKTEKTLEFIKTNSVRNL